MFCHQAVVFRPLLSGLCCQAVVVKLLSSARLSLPGCCQNVVFTQAFIIRSSSGHCHCQAVIVRQFLSRRCRQPGRHCQIVDAKPSSSGHCHCQAVLVRQLLLSFCCRHAYFTLVPSKIPCLRSLEKSRLSFFYNSH